VSYRIVPKRRKQLTSTDRIAAVAVSCRKRNQTERRVLKAVRNLIHQAANSFVQKGQLSSSGSSSSSTVDVVVSKENGGITLNQIQSWIGEKWGTDAADSMEAIKTAAAVEVNRGTLAELTDGSYTLHKEEVSMATSEQLQKRGPGRPKNEDKLRSLAGKSAAVTEPATTVNNNIAVSDSSTVPVSSAKSSSQKRFGGKRKVHFLVLLYSCFVMLDSCNGYFLALNLCEV